ncbi:unnamed protein product [Trichogramma brassicae]|uniref:Reverse transcriptase domain-containing protein n=1 Tax=Trichogramma brassicae TaxID=86971 RepID=A0A6H5IR12_9HYME|nr:unnamed protein product [Trichogramma brassicae]
MIVAPLYCKEKDAKLPSPAEFATGTLEDKLERLDGLIRGLGQFIQSKSNLHKEVISYQLSLSMALSALEKSLASQEPLRPLAVDKAVCTSPLFSGSATSKRLATSPLASHATPKRHAMTPASKQHDDNNEVGDQDGFVLVDRRRHRQRKQTAATPGAVHARQQPKPRPVQRRAHHRPDVIVIKAKDASKYADILRSLKSDPTLQQKVGSSVNNIRRSAAGALMLQLKKGVENASDLGEELGKVLGTAATASALLHTSTIEIKDLDECATKEEVTAALDALLAFRFLSATLAEARPRADRLGELPHPCSRGGSTWPSCVSNTRTLLHPTHGSPMPTAKQLSGCMEEFRCRSAQREYILTSRGPESAEFSISASTLHQDSLRGNFPPFLPTSPRRPAAEGPLLLRGTSTHSRRSGDVAPGTTEDTASSLMSVITGACDASMSKANPRHRREPVYWWTAKIADLRRSCLRARRLFQRSRGRHEEETHSANYASARRLLLVAIKTSKRRCWRQLCDEVNNDVWGKPYKIAMSRLGCPQANQPSSPLLVRGAMAALFPWVPSGPALRLPRRAEEPIPAVTLEELKGAQSRIKEPSAPGPDGIPNSALKIAVAARLDTFLRVYTTCLETGVFPSSWKRQRLVLLTKPGKPPDEPSSYRPLCMLDTAGKILERIICDRLEAFTERPGGLSERQYGFRKGRSTIYAIGDVISTAHEAIAGKRWYRSTKKYCAVVTLDVRNAFNSARWDNILVALRRLLVPDYLLRIIASYFSARVLDFTTDEGPESYEVTAGVPQGSVLGPILWNVMYDAILRLNFDGDVRIVGFLGRHRSGGCRQASMADRTRSERCDTTDGGSAHYKQEKRGNHHHHGRRPQHTLVPLHPLPGPAHRRQAEVRPPPPNSQRKGSRYDRCPYEDHAQLWRAQKQPTQAICSRRRLHTPVRSPLWSTAAQTRAYIQQAESAHRRACLRVIEAAFFRIAF